MSKAETRFAHSEGITDVALTADGSKILTCGSDGDIRIWEDFEDDDPVTFSASDSCLSILAHENTVYVGTENHTIEMFELPNGKALGVKTKFTSGVNHLDISTDGKLLVGGAGDMTLQLILLNDSAMLPKKIEKAHHAPILSVAIDPLCKYVASSGCDGCICIWSLTINPTSISTMLAKKWENVFPKTADVLLSSTLCRMAWSPTNGKHVAIPNNSNQLVIYSREKWVQEFTLDHKLLTKIISIIKYSACGKFIAAGGADGSIITWELSTKNCIFYTNENNLITGLTFAPNNGMYLTDDRGRFLYVKNFTGSETSVPKGIDDTSKTTTKTNDPTTSKDENDEIQDMFNDGMDGFFADDDDDDDPNAISISKIKAEAGFIEDEYVGVDKAAKGIKPGIEDETSNMSGAAVSEGPPRVIYQAAPNPFTDPQETFQPSSTPIHLDHRFMVWNNIGIIRNYSTEDDDEAIDVEFHNTSFHTAIHLRNQFGFTMATLTTEAAVFGCEKESDHPSKLFCLNFATWDTSKEWTIDLPKGENVTCIAMGKGWIAAATSINRIRLFSIGGVQKFIYDLPYEVVTMSGHENLLFIACHCGVGLKGNQSISYSILKVNGFRLHPLVSEVPLPLTPKSILTWIGFSDEGTPITYDSKDNLRILNGSLWSPFCCMKEHLNGPNNHFWVVGVCETAQNVRAIKCKGNLYPPTIPRPTLMLIDAKMPVCEMDTEKSQLEEILLRSFILNSVANKMDKKGYDVDQVKDEADKNIRENLMKLFAMSTRGDRDFRAVEYVSLMPSSHSVQVAIKYAGRLHRMALSERLSAIGREKMETDDIEEIDDCDFETQNKTNYIHVTRVESSYSQQRQFSSSQDLFASQSQNASLRESPMPTTSSSSALNNSNNDSLTLEDNPLLRKQRDAIRAIVERYPVGDPAAAVKNPFKKPEHDDRVKGFALIDAWKIKEKKPEFNPKNLSRKLKKNEKDKEASGRGGNKRKSDKEPNGETDSSGIKKKIQRTLFHMPGIKSKVVDESNLSNSNIENPDSPAAPISNPNSPALSIPDEDSQQLAALSEVTEESMNMEETMEENGQAAEEEELGEEETEPKNDNPLISAAAAPKSSNPFLKKSSSNQENETNTAAKSKFAMKLQLFNKSSEEQETY